MPTATVKIAYVNEAKGKGPANIKDDTGRYFKVWTKGKNPIDLGQFEPGRSYDIEFSESQYDGKPQYTVTKVLSSSTTQTGGGNGSDGTATASAPGRSAAYRNPPTPDEQARISRSHSQEMALRCMALLGGGTNDDSSVEYVIRRWTDYFQLDLDNAPQKPVVEQAKEIFNATEANGSADKKAASW